MRRRRTRWGDLVVGLVIVVALPAVAACGDDADDDADRIATELVDETGGALDESQAACVADGLVASFGDDSFRAVLDAANGDGETAEDVRVEVIDIFAACDALDAVVLDEEPDE